MPSARLLALLAIVAGLAGAFSNPAGARPNPLEQPLTLTSTHFTVHFWGAIVEPENLDRVTYQDAAELAAHAERAYATLVNDWGYPAPLNDGDGLIDIYVNDFGPGGPLGRASTDAPGNTATGWIEIDPSATNSAAVIGHELVHLIQFGQWIPADSWLLEGTAEWAGFVTSGYQPFGGSIEATRNFPDMSLDCESPGCGNDLYEEGGYSRWTFFEYMSDRFGVGFVKDVLARGAALADPLQTGATLLNATLATKGTTLSDVYADYANVNLVGGYDVPGLTGLPPITHATVSTGVASGSLPVQKVPVNHLATRYLKLKRGASTGGACYAATLSLTVGLPAGINARPSFFSRSLGTAAVPLTISGNTATLSVPWDTCLGGYDGYLSLPNPSLDSDARDFVVSGSLGVDMTKVAVPLGPPDPLWTGATVPGPTGEVAPSILVYGAQVVRVSAATRAVRLIVFSSGSGKLEAALGSSPLGRFALRAGNNDVRFKLPPSAIKALRKTQSARAGASTLRLTSVSTAGARGATVVRKLTVTKAKRR
jgi:hypothetical protein